MPGFVIHLAIGEQYARKKYINNKKDFLNGVIAPDLFEKNISHYLDENGNPDFRTFLQTNSLESDYNKGYLLHLVSDYWFYNKFLTDFSSEIYDDYDKLNALLIKKYQVTIPPEIRHLIGFQTGKTTVVSLDKICKFIEALSNLDIEKIENLKAYLQDFDIKEEETDINK